MKNILSFDVEEWYHANYNGLQKEFGCFKSNFRKNMEKIINLCEVNKCKATFFVLGTVAKEYPDIIKRLSELGHDVATHGYSHELAYSQTKDEFKKDVETSKKIIEDITGKPVIGYRAPSWSIREDNFHYLEVLEELGFLYDASVFPVKTFLYGIPSYREDIHKPVVNGRELGLFEVPTSVVNIFGKKFGFSGGFYLRFFPYWFIKMNINSRNKHGLHTVVYLHPREIDPYETKIELPSKEAFIHYYNVKGTLRKLQKIIRNSEFTSIEDFLKKNYC